MKKYKSYIFLTLLFTGFLFVGYIFLNKANGPTAEHLIDQADSLILDSDPPQWEKAFDIIDSNIVAYPELKNDDSLKVRYNHLLDICESLGINKKNNYED